MVTGRRRPAGEFATGGLGSGLEENAPTLSTSGIDIHFRTNGIEQIVRELQPMRNEHMRDEILSQPKGVTVIENKQKRYCPSLRIRHEGEAVVVHIPVRFRRRGGRKEIVLPSDAHTTPDVGPRRPIVVALARGARTDGRKCSTRGSHIARPTRWKA